MIFAGHAPSMEDLLNWIKVYHGPRMEASKCLVMFISCIIHENLSARSEHNPNNVDNLHRT